MLPHLIFLVQGLPCPTCTKDPPPPQNPGEGSLFAAQHHDHGAQPNPKSHCERPLQAEGTISPVLPCAVSISCPVFMAFTPPLQPSPWPGDGTVGLIPASPGEGEPQLPLTSTPSCPALPAALIALALHTGHPMSSQEGPSGTSEIKAWPSRQPGTHPRTPFPADTVHARSPAWGSPVLPCTSSWDPYPGASHQDRSWHPLPAVVREAVPA